MSRSHSHSHDVHHHDHSHSHDAASAHNHSDMAAANRTHFDEHAHLQANMPLAVKMAEHIAPYYLARYPFDKEKTVVLDFACGTGLTSRSIAAHAKSIIGVDISQVSIEYYNSNAKAAGFSPEQMRGVALELKGDAGELDGAKFDVAICSAAYHHITDVDSITRILAGLLKPSGYLLVVDFAAPESGAEVINNDFHHIVPHTKGFTANRVQAMFEGAGLTDFSIASAGEFMWETQHLDLFIARGLKPVTNVV